MLKRLITLTAFAAALANVASAVPATPDDSATDTKLMEAVPGCKPICPWRREVIDQLATEMAPAEEAVEELAERKPSCPNGGCD